MNLNLTCPCGNKETFTRVLSGRHKHKVSNKPKQKIRFSIQECQTCSLAQTIPKPYEDSFTSDCYQEVSDLECRLSRISKIRGYANAALNQIQKYKDKGKLLDLGCSIGVLVSEAEQRGYTAVGIEANQLAVSKGRELFNVQILTEDIYTTSLKAASLDVIMLTHVLEHIESPTRLLKQLKHLLKEDGILYISVPNFSGLMAKFKHRHWRGLDPMRHLWQFTPSTLTHLLKKADFQVVQLILNENLDQYDYELERSSFVMRKIKKHILKRGIETNRGDNLICIARP